MSAESKTPTESGRHSRHLWRRLKLGLLIGTFFLAGFILIIFARRNVGPPPSVFQTSLEQAYPNISKAMKIVAAQTPNGASIRVRDLLKIVATGGFQRLDDQSLFKLIHLQADLAQRSDVATCAALWSGDTVNLVPAIESLPDDQQRQWAQLFAQAAAATASGIPVQHSPTSAQFQAALNRITAGLPPSNIEALKSAIYNSGHLTHGQECEAVRAFYGGLVHANPGDAVVIRRWLLYQ